jgi:hypothetical protein
MDYQHWATGGIPIFEVHWNIRKRARADLTLTAEALPETGEFRKDFGIHKKTDWPNTLYWAHDHKQQGPNALPFPRGGSGSRSFIFAARISRSPKVEAGMTYVPNPDDKAHFLKVLKDRHETDADFVERKDGSTVYTGQLKIPENVNTLVVRGTGHPYDSRKPLIFPFSPIVAQHSGVDSPEYSSLVHDVETGIGGSTLSMTHRAPISTIFRIADVPKQYPIKIGNYAVPPDQKRKIVALNFGVADPIRPIWKSKDPWHGSGLGAAMFSGGGIANFIALLSVDALGPLAYSSMGKHLIMGPGSSGLAVQSGALASYSLWNYNDPRKPSHYGQTGPIPFSPDIEYRAKERGLYEIPVEIVWDKDWVYWWLGQKLQGAYRPQGWADFTKYNPPAGGSTGTTPPGGRGGGRWPDGSGSPPRGGPGGGGGGGPGGPRPNPGVRQPPNNGNGGGNNGGAARPGNGRNGGDGGGGSGNNNGGDNGGNGSGRVQAERDSYSARLRAKWAKKREERARKRAEKRAERERKRAERRARNRARTRQTLKELSEARRAPGAMGKPGNRLRRIGESQGPPGERDNGDRPQDDGQRGPGRRGPITGRNPLDRGHASYSRTPGSAIGESVDSGAGGTNGAGNGGDGGISNILDDGVGGNGRPSSGTPTEVESPSAYFHPIPDAIGIALNPPAFPGQADGIGIIGAFAPGDGNGIPSHADPNHVSGPSGPIRGGQRAGQDESERDGHWRERVGFTEKQWNEVPLVAHDISIPVYDMGRSEPNSDDPNRRAPPVTVRDVAYDAAGNRLAAIGPGTVLTAPANLGFSDTFLRNRARLPAVIPSVVRGVLAIGEAGVARVDGKLAIGARADDTSQIASGVEIGLEYDGPGGDDVPDVHIRTKDQNAENSGTGRLFFNGERLSGTGGWAFTDVTTDEIIAAGGATATFPLDTVAARTAIKSCVLELPAPLVGGDAGFSILARVGISGDTDRYMEDREVHENGGANAGDAYEQDLFPRDRDFAAAIEPELALTATNDTLDNLTPGSSGVIRVWFELDVLPVG